MTSEVKIEITTQNGANARAQQLARNAQKMMEQLRKIARENAKRARENATKKSS